VRHLAHAGAEGHDPLAPQIGLRNQADQAEFIANGSEAPMARLNSPTGPRPPGPDLSSEDEALAEVRQRERTNLKDIFWVVVVLVIITVMSFIYETGQKRDRKAAEHAAQLRAQTMTALPPPGYSPAAREPSEEEVEADAAAREARAVVAANDRANATDPLLNPPKKASDLPPLLPSSPKPFSDPNYGLPAVPAGAAPVPAPAEAAPPPRPHRPK
jgi:hypothetical protein